METYSLLVAGKDFIYLHGGFSSIAEAQGNLEKIVSCFSKKGMARVLSKGYFVAEIAFDYRKNASAEI